MCRKLIQNRIETLPQLKLYNRARLTNIFKSFNHINDRKLKEIYDVIDKRIPLIEWKCFFSGTSHDICMNETVDLVIKFKRHGGDPSRIYSPKWSKPKMEGTKYSFLPQ